MASQSRMIVARERRRSDGAIVGVTIVHVTSDQREVAGALDDPGVDPAWQGRGIGTALTPAACPIARDQDADRIVLNATPSGERVYRQLDFAVAGDGQTWRLPIGSLSNSPSPVQVSMAEAIAHDDVQRLDLDVARWEQVPNGESPVGVRGPVPTGRDDPVAARPRRRPGHRVPLDDGVPE